MRGRDVLRAALALIVFVLIYGSFQIFAPTGDQGGAEVRLEIESGTSFREAAERLHGAGLIRDPNMFVALGRLSGLHRKLRPGRYVFTGVQSPWKVFNTLMSGRSSLWHVTVTEGENLVLIGEKLEAEGLMSAEDFLSLASAPALLAALNINAPSLEGYIYPDTYFLSKGMEPERIVGVMVERMREVTGPLMERMREQGIEEHEVLTLASIVGTEAVLDKERPVIAAVYLNRLKRKMRLQADPTVVYGIKHMRQGISKEDLKRETPYNTYVINGLPPGPIASPGEGSIKAVLSPAEVPYIYFVSNNDGSHRFSSTLREHNKAVKAYRRGRSGKRNGNGG